jgi:hypothetical protein
VTYNLPRAQSHRVTQDRLHVTYKPHLLVNLPRAQSHRDTQSPCDV